jgi:hypothetical protein
MMDMVHPLVGETIRAGSPSMWHWLKDESNRKVLAFLGAGLVALAGAGWTAFTYLDGKSGGGANVEASDGGVAIGRDNTGTITTNRSDGSQEQ